MTRLRSRLPEQSRAILGEGETSTDSAPFRHAQTISRESLAVQASYSELVAALNLAIVGLPNPPAIQAGYDQLKTDLAAAAQPFTEAHLQTLADLGQINW